MVLRVDLMFRIFTFRQLSILSIAICLIMLCGAFLNAISPLVEAFSTQEVQVVVIMYHQISHNTSLYGDYVISPALLEKDFQYMKDSGITPISFETLTKYVTTGEGLPQKPVVITFDDGERSFLTKVVPLLEKYKFPANVNIVGSLTELYTKNGETNDAYAYLNESDIKALNKHPLVELGCHSYDMHSLNGRRGMGKLYKESQAVYEDKLQKDFDLFSESFLRMTGEKPTILAYPYGIRNEALLRKAKDNGFTVTLTCREAPNSLKKGSSLYELGRFNRPYSESTETFFTRIFSH
jgi:peptidoglycan/xylan/chitin deacetylase (PgdA/CDA1 family)